jgi:hypothetical protein
MITDATERTQVVDDDRERPSGLLTYQVKIRSLPNKTALKIVHY